jgi:hypothetical protein
MQFPAVMFKFSPFLERGQNRQAQNPYKFNSSVEGAAADRVEKTRALLSFIAAVVAAVGDRISTLFCPRLRLEPPN